MSSKRLLSPKNLALPLKKCLSFLPHRPLSSFKKLKKPRKEKTSTKSIRWKMKNLSRISMRPPF
jgi:hypothetical protein